MFFGYDAQERKENSKLIVKWIAGVIAALTLWMGVAPVYNVWSQGMAGQAALERAQQERQIAVLDAQAEVARARGVAEANAIVADGLGGPEGYLEYLYIDALKNHQGSVIYVPTEAGLPITEANRFQR